LTYELASISNKGKGFNPVPSVPGANLFTVSLEVCPSVPHLIKAALQPLLGSFSTCNWKAHREYVSYKSCYNH